MPIRPKKKSKALASAQEAVNVYEEEASLLLDMKASFRADFPDANVALQNILRQEDLVQDKVKVVIPLIREAKRDVGEFKCQLKRSLPGYDPNEFMKLASDIEEGGDILIELIEQGYIKKLVLDPSIADYFSQHPIAAEHFSGSWCRAKDLTPAITPPKF